MLPNKLNTWVERAGGGRRRRERSDTQFRIDACIDLNASRPRRLKCPPGRHRESSGIHQRGEFRVATPTAARPAQRNCALGPGLWGLNWGSSGPYRAANPHYQNSSSAPKMRIVSVLRGASSARNCFARTSKRRQSCQNASGGMPWWHKPPPMHMLQQCGMRLLECLRCAGRKPCTCAYEHKPGMWPNMARPLAPPHRQRAHRSLG